MVLVEAVGGHRRWVLVVGYDSDRQLYGLQDPSRGLHAVPWASFHSNWEKTGFVTVLGVPRA